MSGAVKQFMHKLSGELELPVEIFGGISILTFKGRTELTISECSSILKYETDEVMLKLCDMILTVYGSGIQLKTFHGKRMVLTGSFTKTEFGGQ